jgi:hypothetical protein
VSSTASQAGENDQTNVATKRSFQAFQHTQPSEEVAEEEQHRLINPYTSQADSPRQQVPKGQTRAKLSPTSTTASTVNPKNERTN